MAHIVGVPKRDPCQKCALPVFLAERLTVGKRVYHRTCLKCARCGSQLTPGSFYETEVDDEYCCETCPDEEVTLGNKDSIPVRNLEQADFNDESDVSDSAGAAAVAVITRPKTTVRSSIADRLAFFEHSTDGGKKFLQKSLSDEEKSKSLKHMNQQTSSSASWTMNPAQSSFMSSTLNDETAVIYTTANTAQIENCESVLTSSESEPENDADELCLEMPPALPEVPPPTIEPQEKGTFVENILSKRHQQKDIFGRNIDTLSSEIKFNITDGHVIITNDNANATNNNNYNLINDNKFDNAEDENVNADNTKMLLTLNETYDSNYVTKDSSECDVQLRTKANNVDRQNPESSEEKPTEKCFAEQKIKYRHDDDNDQMQSCDSDKLKKPGSAKSNLVTTLDEETTNRLSVVRARLHQFEVIVNNTSETTSSINCNIKDSNKKNLNENTSKIEETCSLNVNATPNADHNEQTGDKKPNKVPTEHLQIKTDEETVSISNQEQQEQIENGLPQNLNSISNSSSNSIVEMKTEAKDTVNLVQQNPIIANENDKKTPALSPLKIEPKDYPEDLNPFKSDEDNDDEDDSSQVTYQQTSSPTKVSALLSTTNRTDASQGRNPERRKSLNPFDSSDDEVEIEKKVKPPRPPPPKITKNPFGSESDDGDGCGEMNVNSISNVPMTKKPPVPTPRTNVSLSQNPTPEPTPRLSAKKGNNFSPTEQQLSSPLHNSEDYYGSAVSLGTPYNLQRNSDGRGSNNSLTSSTGTIRSRKSRKAPAPPPPVKELFPSTETVDSKVSTPTSSNSATPHQSRKKRLAPAPPKPARLDSKLLLKTNINLTDSKNSVSYPLQSDLDKLSDEEKALLEGNRFEEHHLQEDIDLQRRHLQLPPALHLLNSPIDSNSIGAGETARRLIPLDFSIVEDAGKSDDTKHKEEDNVVYRRTIIPNQIETPTHERNTLEEAVSHDRQLEKLKDNKEAKNRNRQSQISSSGAEDIDPLYNKSSHGKWKRRKGPAPALPIPPRKVLQMLPLQEIRHEFDIIEVQQQGLEKQGVVLEKMIRDRCEGINGEPLDNVVNVDGDGHFTSPPNSKEVEDLILQLFELVNEKNELFRRQAELMYLRRQHRLEQEQADIEYEIRVLMAQPERNKTDSDKAREEALIARMVEVVQLRNEVVECLEMDRLREAEEDLSIKQRLEMHSAKREEELCQQTPTKLSKKEKKKQKEAKKLGKSKKLDADKDADESETNMDKQKTKKKKKKFLF